MQVIRVLAPIFIFSAIALAGGLQPMEPITNYNVIMVHGASDHWNGMDVGGAHVS
jgi:hypothetical protein